MRDARVRKNFGLMGGLSVRSGLWKLWTRWTLRSEGTPKRGARRWGRVGLLLALLLAVPPALAQFEEYNHPELKWKTLETEHFFAHFSPENEREARIVIAIGEEIYEPITSMYNYRPDGKVHFVIRDHDDYSNGGAWYYDNKIEIWAKPLDFELRGTHNWLYDVVTHEFTHIIQLGASRVGPRWLPALYFQNIGYESEKRPDVLRGYPNQIMSWPVAFTSVPMWLAEGTAQYQNPQLGHDWWDSHRDMNLRVRALNHHLLTLSQMGVFGKNSIDAESVYNHGLSLVRFIAHRYGDGALRNLSHQLSRPRIITFNQACKNALGITDDELYKQWLDSLISGYELKTATIREHLVSGELIYDKGFANLYPQFSPDGKRLAFLTNEGEDYLSLSHYICFDVEEGKIVDKTKAGKEQSKTIKEGQFNAPGFDEAEDSPVKGAFDWSPDGKRIVYSRKSGPNRHGSHFNDLYLWDPAAKKDYRLTKDARLSQPSFAPDGKRIVAVHNAGGSNNLVIAMLPDSLGKDDDLTKRVTWEFLTHFDDGRQMFSPRFAPDGKTIYLTMLLLDPRDICKYDLNEPDWQKAWQPVVCGKADDRDVTITPDGSALVFASDRTGIFNLYRMNIADSSIVPLTNVLGGAFMPAVSPEGQIAYSEFEDGGFRMRWLTDPQPVPVEYTRYLDLDQQERPDLPPLPSYDGAVKSYSAPFNKLFVIPRLMWDYGVFKPGFYAYTGDLLDKVTLFAGAAMDAAGERDLYLSGEYRQLAPTLFLEAYNITRKQRQTFDDNWVIIGERIENGVAVPIYDIYTIDYSFDLTELDLGARYPVFNRSTASLTYRNSRYKAVMEFDDGSSFSYTYHRGDAAILRLDADRRALKIDDDIHPRGGWRGWIEAGQEWNRFLDGFEVEAEKGTIVEVYDQYDYTRLETDLDYYQTLYQDLVVNPRLIGGWISQPVDPFYHLYAGGLPGLRGYSFYSLGGTRKLAGRLSLRLPVWTNIDRSWGPWYLDRVHAGIFAEAGDAWEGGHVGLDDVKKDVGGELRLRLFSWYGYPTDVQFTGAYGLDQFTISDDTGSLNTYGREWRWYVTVLFDFI